MVDFRDPVSKVDFGQVLTDKKRVNCQGKRTFVKVNAQGAFIRLNAQLIFFACAFTLTSLIFAGFCKFFRFQLAFCKNENILLPNQANVAQSVEQRIRNAQVIGSNPIIGSIFLYRFRSFGCWHCQFPEQFFRRFSALQQGLGLC